MVILPLVVFVLFVRAYLASRLENEYVNRGQTALNAAQRVVEDYLASNNSAARPEQLLDDEVLAWLARVVGHDLHLYRDERLVASSRRDLFAAHVEAQRLPGDVYSHNEYVPVQLIVSYRARTLKHIYWEARFDAAQERDRCRLIRTVLGHRYPDCDRLVERVVERTLFSFRTNKRIFNSVMALQQYGQWQRMIRRLSERSRYPLPTSEVERFNTVCVDAIQDLLVRGQASACQLSDPTGRETLSRAESLRRKLRALRRRGRMTDAIDAEVRALVA